MCQAWFARFESGNFNLEDEEMETSLDEDSSQTQEEDVVYSNQFLKEVYGDQVPGERTCYKWFKEFKKGNFELVERHVGSSKKFEDEELNLLLKKDSSQTISYRLKEMGMIRNVGKWIPSSTITAKK